MDQIKIDKFHYINNSFTFPTYNLQPKTYNL